MHHSNGNVPHAILSLLVQPGALLAANLTAKHLRIECGGLWSESACYCGRNNGEQTEPAQLRNQQAPHSPNQTDRLYIDHIITVENAACVAPPHQPERSAAFLPRCDRQRVSCGGSVMNQIITEFDVPASMRDGTTLRANIYRPAGEGQWPVLLTRHTPHPRCNHRSATG
jgi:hypothetical protein